MKKIKISILIYAISIFRNVYNIVLFFIVKNKLILHCLNIKIVGMVEERITQTLIIKI